MTVQHQLEVYIEIHCQYAAPAQQKVVHNDRVLPPLL